MPTFPAGVLSSTYDYRLVAVSVLIAMLASYAALDLGGRVTASSGILRTVWLFGGAAAMGLGIWSMHYIGMLAYNLPVAVYYHLPTVLYSLLAAMLASGIALFVVSRKGLGFLSVGVGGLLMGAGIAAMHYVGMAAMRMPAMCVYSPGLVTLSVLLAIIISMVALFLTFHLRSETNSMSPRKLASMVLMGSAIPVMHYTGMAAASFIPTQAQVDLTGAVKVSSIGIIGIGGVTFMVLLLAIVTSFVDRRFSARTLQLHQSEQSYRELVEAAQVVLWRGELHSNHFSYINHEAEALLGYGVKDWLGSAAFWLDHLHPEDRALAEARCRAVAEEQGPQKFEHRMIAADGRAVWLNTSIRLVAGKGHDKEIAGVMTDITARKEAQEAAEEASRTKSGLLAEINALHDQLKQENHRMSGELEITQRLQQMMLPRDEDMSKFAGLDISGSMQPATEVGGDYYDVVRKDGGVVFGIGDVTGHGLESGVIAIMVQTAVRTLLASGRYESHSFFKTLNRVIYDNVRRMNCDRNLTLSLLHYQDRMVTISGQHEEVLVVRRDGAVERHDTVNLGFPLGLEEDISSFIGEESVPFSPGDVMVAYTDGITEAMNSAGVSFGVERLSEAVRTSHESPAQAIREAVIRSLQDYVGGQQLLDDISLLVIKAA